MAARVLGRIPGGHADVLREPPDERPVLGRNQFAAGSQQAARVPFDVERRAIEANGGRPVSRSQLIVVTPRTNVAPVMNSVTRPSVGNSGAAPSNAMWRARGEQARAQTGDVARQNSQPVARPRDNGDTVNAPLSLSDRPSWAQYQRDESQRAQQSRDDARRAIPEQRQWARDNIDREQRARESAARNAPSSSGLSQQQSLPQQSSNPGLTVQPSAVPAAQQWRGDNRPPQRVERSQEPQQLHSNGTRPQTSREVTPSRTWSPSAQPQPQYQPQQQYRSQPVESHRVEQPRNDPPAQRPQSSSSPQSSSNGNSDHASRSQNNNSRSGGNSRLNP